MKKNELIIVVPGSKYIQSRTKIMQNIILFFYSMTRIFKPVYSNYAKEWANKFDGNGQKVIWLHWGRGLTPVSVFFAVRKLKRLIKEYRKKYNIKLTGISLGAEIAVEAAQCLDADSIKKIVLVCPTNKHTKIQIKTPIVNIYSPYDLFARIASKVLAPIHGGVKLQGKNVKNISLPKMTHADFCADKKIKSGKYKGKSITELINNFLKI